MAAKRTKKKAAGRKRTRKKKATRASTVVEADPTVTRIQQVIELMVSTGAVEVEMEEAGSRLRVRLKEERPAVAYAAPAMTTEVAPPRNEAVSAQDAGPAAPPPGPVGEVFRSPMVGTFYRAPSPDAEPFVKAGDRIHFESPLCIIEAMKVMNEIKAEMEGEVVEILAQNGEPVDYGQPLFVIKV